MSLMISLSPDQVEQRLAAMGIVCRFTSDERIALATTPVVSRAERIFAFPTPAANEALTLSNIKSCVGSDPRHQRFRQVAQAEKVDRHDGVRGFRSRNSGDNHPNGSDYRA